MYSLHSAWQTTPIQNLGVNAQKTVCYQIAKSAYCCILTGFQGIFAKEFSMKSLFCCGPGSCSRYPLFYYFFQINYTLPVLTCWDPRLNCHMKLANHCKHDNHLRSAWPTTCRSYILPINSGMNDTICNRPSFQRGKVCPSSIHSVQSVHYYFNVPLIAWTVYYYSPSIFSPACSW